jgi:hypothetical protein
MESDRMRRTIAFFRIVPPVPPLLTSTFLVVTAVSAVVVIVEPSRSTGALTAIGLLQMFSSASGFAGPARRGYYDLLLTRGDRRLYIALAQWLMSIAAGLACWLALAGAEAIAAGNVQQALAPGTVVAMVLVSTVPWATTVALPRFAAAVGWLLVMVLAATIAPGLSLQSSVWAVRAAAVLLMPASLVGVRFPAGALVVIPALTSAALAMGVAFWWINSVDVPLEAAQ